MKIETEAKEVAKLKQELNYLDTKANDLEDEIKGLDAEVVHAQDAREVVQLLAQAIQQQAHAKVSEVVTRCLTAVFDDPYEFKIEFERKQGKTEANLRFVRRGLDVDPLTASGGGMVDVAAFALRVACLILSRPRLSKVLVLDEPFRFVSVKFQENVRVMMEQLSEDMDIQIIMVTHNQNFVTGNVIEL